MRLAAIAVLLVSTAAVAQSAPQSSPAPAQNNGPEAGAFGFDVAGMDRSVAPGDDFYSYANGTWDKTTEIPTDRSAFGAPHVLVDRSLEQTRAILETAAAKPGSQIGDYYASYMDEAAAEKKGATPVKPLLAAIAGAEDKTALALTAADLARSGLGSLVGFGIRQDAKEPEKYIVFARQGGIALPDRDYYLKDDPKLETTRTAYKAYLAQLLTLAGESDATARANAVFEMEKAIAQGHWTRVESRNVEKTYNRWSAADFDAKAPGFPWGAYLKALGMAGQPYYIVGQPEAVTTEAKVFADAPIAVLRDYYALRVLDTLSPYLNAAFVKANFDFNGTVLAGTPQQKPRWKRAVSRVSEDVGEAVGKEYVAHYFPPASKAAIDDLVRNVRAAMSDRLGKLEWMAPETKAKAIAKLAAFTPKIGYPDTWRDYSSLTIKRDDLVGNALQANRFEFGRQLNKLGKPIDRGEWLMAPMTVNAYANPTMNEIVFPAGILQSPFFDAKADPAVNYGGIGAVIGHELSHHFDDQGRKYDPTGKLADWWTPQDVERFKAFADKLIRQYDAYEPLPGQHVQGALTLGENIADLAGLTVAYEAYQRSLRGKAAPVLDGVTGDQRFYYGWAQVWRTKYRDAYLKQILLSDTHSPGHERANIVRNLDPWYAAFKAKAGEKLYLAPEERVRIW